MIRIATYNIHKCRGMDRRVDPDRVARVINSLDADVIALQEVLHEESDGSPGDQLRRLVALTGYRWSFGETRAHRGSPYGNATLSRFPIVLERNYDITWRHRERRGCLRTDIQLPSGDLLHVFNVHLGTSYFERPHQARTLMEDALARSSQLGGPRVVVGDFNEWTRGVASTLMASEFDSVDARLMRPTYPGVFPIFRLDHFYFDKHLKLERFTIRRDRLSKLASDHLPIVGDFRIVADYSHPPRRS